MMNQTQPPNDNNLYKENMYKVIAELFESTGANNPGYSETQKANDILEVLATLLAFTIYNSCPTSEAIRDAAEATYFQIKQMSLGYFYQQSQQSQENNLTKTSAPGRMSNRKINQPNPR